MSNVLQFNGETTNDIAPNKILEGAKDKLDEVVVCGIGKDNKLYIASSTSDIAKVNLSL